MAAAALHRPAAEGCGRAAARRPAQQRRRLAVAAASAAALPQSAAEALAAAATASRAALADGIVRQRVQVLMPVNQRAGPGQYCNTEALDYPCSASEEFRIALDAGKTLARSVSDGDEDLSVERIGDGGLDGDNAAVLYPAQSRDRVTVVCA